MNDMRGDNFPPEPTPIERGDELVAACNRWTAEVPQIADAEQAGRCQALVDQLRLEREAIEAEWKSQREPHDRAIIALRAHYRPPLELLGIALDKMKLLAGNWLARERARLEQEAFDRREQAAKAEVAARIAREEATHTGTVEAEAKARRAQDEASAALSAAAKPVDRPAIKGDYSARAMSMRGTWRAVVFDEQKALKHFAKHPAVRAAALDAITKLCTKQAQAAKDATQAPPGVRFERKETAA